MNTSAAAAAAMSAAAASMSLAEPVYPRPTVSFMAWLQTCCPGNTTVNLIPGLVYWLLVSHALTLAICHILRPL